MYHIDERTLEEGKYIVATGATVRKAAEKFGVSKSTVHKDMTERLQYLDGILFSDVKRILEQNLAERHLRGGLATKNKFAKKKE